MTTKSAREVFKISDDYGKHNSIEYSVLSSVLYFMSLCSLMTPGLTKDISCHV